MARFLFGGIVDDETKAVNRAAAITLRHLAELYSDYECVCFLPKDKMHNIDPGLIKSAESPSFATRYEEELPFSTSGHGRQCLLLWYVADKLDNRK